jgi:hypothetical protein
MIKLLVAQNVTNPLESKVMKFIIASKELIANAYFTGTLPKAQIVAVRLVRLVMGLLKLLQVMVMLSMFARFFHKKKLIHIANFTMQMAVKDVRSSM